MEIGTLTRPVAAFAIDPADGAPLGDVLARHGAQGAGAPVVVAKGDGAGALTPALLARLSAAVLRLDADRRERAIDALVALHLDGQGRPDVEQDLIDDNARLRARLLATLPMWTAAEVSAARARAAATPPSPTRAGSATAACSRPPRAAPTSTRASSSTWRASRSPACAASSPRWRPGRGLPGSPPATAGPAAARRRAPWTTQTPWWRRRAASPTRPVG